MKRETTLIFNIVLALSLVGIVAVFSASIAQSNAAGSERMPDLHSYLVRQAVFVGIGLVAMLMAMRFDYHLLRRRVYLYGLVGASLATLVAVLVMGVRIGGAQRWIPLLGMTFQPSELAKLAMIVALAVLLTERQDEVKSLWRGFLPAMGLMALFTGLVVMERDLSTPTVMGMVALLMVFMAGARWWHLLVSGGLAVAAFAGLCVTHPHRMERLYAFVDPWKYRSDEGLQLIESLAAFARGGVWGAGLGGGEQKLFYLPEANTDFIFAVWGEEMGLMGTLALLALFVIFLVVGLRIALCAPDMFGALLAAGIVALIALQAAINMGVTTGILPTTGLPLPFISKGGSALVINMAMVGVLLSVGRQSVESELAGRLAPTA